MVNLWTLTGSTGRLLAAAALPLLATVPAVGNGAPAADAAAANPILVEYGFEGIAAYIPNWGAGYGSTYKPATGWKEPFVVSLDREDPHSGQAAMSVRFSAGNEQTIRVHSPAIKVPEPLRGKDITVECYVKGEGIDPAKIGLGVMQKDAEGKTIGYVGNQPTLVAVTAGSDWSKISLKGRLNTRAASILLMFTAVEGQPESRLFVDDIIVLSAD